MTVIAHNHTALVTITVVGSVEIRYSRGVRKREIHNCEDGQMTRSLHFCKWKPEDMPCTRLVRSPSVALTKTILQAA